MREATLSSNGNFHDPATIYALGVPSSIIIFYCIAVVVTIAISLGSIFILTKVVVWKSSQIRGRDSHGRYRQSQKVAPTKAGYI